MAWQAVKNLLSGDYFIVKKAPLFTAYDQPISPHQALVYFNKRDRFAVKYRGVHLYKLFNKLAFLPDNVYEFNMLTGYIPEKDAFVFIKYNIKTEDDAVCCICLEDLREGIPVRIYGNRCFHDLHMKCLNNIENKKIAGCCSYENRCEVIHASVVEVTCTKAKLDLKSPLCLEWCDYYILKVESSDPSKVYDHICHEFENFISICHKPYVYTVESFDSTWKKKNKICPV